MVKLRLQAHDTALQRSELLVQFIAGGLDSGDALFKLEGFRCREESAGHMR